MNQKPPQDYSLEKLSKTDGFQIYPPVNADFKFETLNVDDDTLPDLPNYVDDNDYNPHPNPNKLHMIPGDFDNDPNTQMNTIIKDKPTRKYYINGPPKKKKKRKSYNLDFTGTPMLRIPTQEQLAKRFNPNVQDNYDTDEIARSVGVPQPYRSTKPWYLSNSTGFGLPENEKLIINQFKNKKRKSKFDISTLGDSIITNNSLVSSPLIITFSRNIPETTHFRTHDEGIP
jgi:hypothetical protein